MHEICLISLPGLKCAMDVCPSAISTTQSPITIPRRILEMMVKSSKRTEHSRYQAIIRAGCQTKCVTFDSAHDAVTCGKLLLAMQNGSDTVYIPAVF